MIARTLLILSIITVSFAQNHENVEQVGRIYNQWDYAYDVVVVDDLAYVAAGHAGLQIVDVSDPGHPVNIGYWDDNPGYAYDVTVSGEYAYIADGTAGLRIISVTDPEYPEEVGYFDTEGEAYRIAVSGNYAYLASTDIGLRVLSVADPENPHEVGYYETPGRANGVALSEDGLIFVADRTNVGIYRFTLLNHVESPWGDVRFTSIQSNVIFDEATYGGDELEAGDWVGVFTPDDLCAGAYQIDAEIDDIGLAAWGDDSETEEIDGFNFDEAMSFRIWKTALDRGFDAEIINIRRGEAVWNLNALLICSINATPESAPLDMIPDVFSLSPVYPNPFNSTTTITYSLPFQSNIIMQIHDLSGREITELVRSRINAGSHEAMWDAVGVPSGLYFVRLEAAGQVATQKVMLIK